MKIIPGNARAVAITATLVLSFFGGPALAGETPPAKEQNLTDQASAYIRDYLSDSRRAGSLAGSILGGALFAHPAGPILGSLVGFLIGKQTMFDEDKTRGLQAQNLLARRSIVPQDGKGGSIPTLSFASAQGVTFDTPAAPETVSGLSPQPLQVAIPMAAPSSFSREQIATMCGSGRALIDPRLRSLCFYFQGNWQDERGAASTSLAQASP